MLTKSNANSRRMYSWWWDSHISPKNSKWLQENLTDMDSKVKQMIKLIEEDADSFARRAEMYYKKRPELMKLVEELYRAYRALAERYDNATGVIRHAHRTMSESFPNQLPMLFGDESSAGASSYEGDPRTPEMSTPVRNGALAEETDIMSNGQGLDQLNDLAASGSSRVRRGLTFHDGVENGKNSQSTENHNLSESEQVSKAEAEIMALKSALAKLEAEKEASVLQCQQSLEKLSKLESAVSLAQEDSRGLNERAMKAEAEVQILKESLVKFESEKEFSLLQYQKCLQNIADLEAAISHAQKDIKEINVRASEAEAETQTFKQDLARVEVEKDTALVQYNQCLDTISYQEDRLQKAEEDVSKIKIRAEKAEAEVENLKHIISTLTKEKEASALQYQQCVDTIADLKLKLFQAQDEAQRLSRDIEDGAAKLRVAEEKCGLLENSNQTLHSELDNLLHKLGNQSQELTEKQKELGRLWTSIQEEHLRFVEAETAFQTLQQLHSQSEEELRLLAAERQTRAQILKDVETRNDALLEAVQKFKEENKGLNDVNRSSAASIKSLQEEVSSLRGTIEKLEAEVELRVDQRNALQQEIYCLKEELNEISQKHQAMKDQMEVVGLDPECFGSSVKKLQDENSNLKDSLDKERSESASLLEKLALMEKLVEKNAVLGRFISDLNTEIEQVRGKVKTLEESCESLSKEKSVLVDEKDNLRSQLQISTDNIGKLSKTNIFLENSLLDATAELEELRIQLKRIEDSCLELDSEKSGLITEKESLASQLGITRNSLEDLGKEHAELTMKVLALEKEREASVHKIEELKAVMDLKNGDFANLEQSSQDRMGVMELQIHHLAEENLCKEKEYQKELGRGFSSQLEQFVFHKCLEDLLEKHVSLKVDYNGLREAYSLSERLISDMEHENRGKQMQIESLADGVRILRLGLQQILERLGIEPGIGSGNEQEQDLKVMGDIVNRLDEMQNMVSEVQDENQHSAIENVVLVALLRQLNSEVADIAREKDTLDQESKIRCLQLLSLQCEIQKLVETNGKLSSEVKERGLREEALKTEANNFNKQLLDLQDAYQDLQQENTKILDEKRFLSKLVLCLEEEKHNLEDEFCLTLTEALYQGSLSLILKDSILDKLSDVKSLSGDLGRLHCIKDKLEEKVHDRDGKLKDAQSEYTQLSKSLEMYKTELSSLRSIHDQFTHDITTGKELLCQKEKELLEVAQMLSLVQTEKTELLKEMNDLTSKHNEVKGQQTNQETHILKLCGDFDDQVSETRRVSEAKQMLESKLQKLHQELEETKQEKEMLSDKAVKERTEASFWESQAADYYEDLQMSTVNEILLAGKVHELATDFQIKSASNDVEFNQLKERLSCLEEENKELKAHAAKHIQAAVLLNDSISSLENCVHSNTKSDKSDDDVTKGSGYVTTVHAESHAQAREDEPLGLQSLHVRVKTIEEALREKERVLIIENSSASSRLETAMKQIEYLKSGSRRSKKRQDEDSRRQKHDRRISREEIEVVTKDIMLDQISDCSSYGRSKRTTLESDDHKLIETSEQTPGSDNKLEKLHNVKDAQTVDVIRRSKGKTFSEDSIIDKLEISDRFADPNPQINQRKVLERLDSDLQKLSNLHITVQDLKGRVEVEDNGKNKKGDDQETVKGQLEEAEEAITKLFDVNRRLTTRVEKGFSSSDGKSGDVEDNGNGRRVRISEMARRASEKLGRLQLEVQRIQFLLLKLDGEREKTKVSGKDKRVLLKDYIYDGPRSGGMKKKKPSRFCACVQPRSP